MAKRGTTGKLQQQKKLYSINVIADYYCIEFRFFYVNINRKYTMSFRSKYSKFVQMCGYKIAIKKVFLKRILNAITFSYNVTAYTMPYHLFP